MAAPMLEQAHTLLQTGQADEALPIARKAMLCLAAPSVATALKLPALELLGEIHIELGDSDEARKMFEAAVDLDPEGMIEGISGGGADRFLWLAQLSENGGEESVAWFHKGAAVLRRELGLTAIAESEEEEVVIITKRYKLANALCGAAEVYMTDLS